ncbi:MAG: bifunctional 5,10-methylenetetrahydrofolate dehydrogenase/5,10-methenyltetrahydrofolate cyclohydrolase [Syntrophomonadaceae bacterium]|nr:bifunctional 5,10-methylenetetrahydrofolate dehydrogenase/5,10-methenyltetrahydrofolate cyclohydrolase [Bacillota bacterium]NLM88829.1 bifunctional 5,10-methylenetetrahydrofolate dehydrogenase/5,10-methenyltetrahydrofolate cyclohydrolase [Syntrophomonadaceae bacterium]HQA49176.1 bifunctional 5,10-methylenetetrahydrofolate dehydrogenase/5,10-methenyltetrahydrofolate cyclohydrolase [Syntrophomonadaceae bacterium]HQD89789.1 bifunctional 5,10-methylenetetrahydrofolate dehydrogenase/5,10-methenylt
MELINGREISDEIRLQVKEKVQTAGISPNLGIIIVGDDKESLLYVGLKEKAVSFIGGTVQHLVLPGNTSRETLLERISKLNQDPSIDGILLQLPLPEPLQAHADEFLAAIDVNKDVDGFNPINRGRLIYGTPRFISCAALGCLDVIHRSCQTTKGKTAVLVGDSFDVILPLALLLNKEGCQVTVVPEMPMKSSLPDADIYVIEKGHPESLQAHQVANGSLILDVGFYWHYDHSCGNVKPEALSGMEGKLLPVPGGLGPILIAKLVENLYLAAAGEKD